VPRRAKVHNGELNAFRRERSVADQGTTICAEDDDGALIGLLDGNGRERARAHPFIVPRLDQRRHDRLPREGRHLGEVGEDERIPPSPSGVLLPSNTVVIAAATTSRLTFFARKRPRNAMPRKGEARSGGVTLAGFGVCLDS
jgi:hypothetical protein